MPTIPRYDGPQIQQQGAPDARQTQLSGAVPEGAFGEGLARGLGQAGAILQKAQDDADRVRVFEARNKLQNAVNDSLYGKEGVFNRKGKNAAGAATQWETDFDTAAQEIANGLTPRQREMYEQAAAEIRTPHRRQVLNYETDQWRAVEDGTFTAAAETSLNTIGLNYNDQDILAREMAIMDGAIIKKNQLAGTDAEVSNLERAQWASRAHAQVATAALAAGNIGYAKEYFDQHREQMLPQERLRLEATINTQSSKEEGLVGAQEAYSIAPNDIQAGMNFLRDKFKDNIQALEYSQSELKSIHTESDIVRRQQQDAAWNTQMNKFAQLRAGGRVPKLADFDTAGMNGESQLKLMQMVEVYADRQAREAKEFRDDQDRLRERQLDANASRLYWNMVMNSDMNNVDLRLYAPEFVGTSRGEAMLKDLVKIQNDVKNGDTTKFTRIQGHSELVNGYLEPLVGKGNLNTPAANDIKTRFQIKLNAFEATKKGLATPDEERRIARDMFTKRDIDIPGMFNDINKAPIQMTEDDIKEIASIKNVPASERRELVDDFKATLKARRLPVREPTEKELLEIFVNNINRAR